MFFKILWSPFPCELLQPYPVMDMLARVTNENKKNIAGEDERKTDKTC